MRMINCTAATLRAILCFVDAANTPKIAFDNDALAIPLANKIKEAVGSMDGSQPSYICFDNEEEELLKQFNGVCNRIKSVFDQIEFVSQPH